MKSATLLLLSAMALLSCGQKKAAENAPDSTNASLPAPALKEFFFDDTQFLLKPLLVDLTDTAAVARISPAYRHTGASWEDGRPWYRYYEFDGSLTVAYFDYYNNESPRIWVKEIFTADSTVQFARGIRVGMRKADFLRTFKLTDPDAVAADVLTASYGSMIGDGPHHTGHFTFSDDRLASVRMLYNHSNMPHSLEDFAFAWTSVNIKTVDGKEETYRDCAPYTYLLQDISVMQQGEPVTKTVLEVGLVQDSRTDTVEWIRRTARGLKISTKTTEGFNFIATINFTAKDWTAANWNDEPFMPSDIAGTLSTIDCAGGGEEDQD